VDLCQQNKDLMQMIYKMQSDQHQMMQAILSQSHLNSQMMSTGSNFQAGSPMKGNWMSGHHADASLSSRGAEGFPPPPYPGQGPQARPPMAPAYGNHVAQGNGLWQGQNRYPPTHPPTFSEFNDRESHYSSDLNEKFYPPQANNGTDPDMEERAKEIELRRKASEEKIRSLRETQNK
jgi:hypothetical protein